MRQAKVYNHKHYAGLLIDNGNGTFIFEYTEDYNGPPISLTMPTSQRVYQFDTFPPFFDGLLPEGMLLEAMLKSAKIDRNDLFAQLVTVGHDLVGSVTIEADDD